VKYLTLAIIDLDGTVFNDSHRHQLYREGNYEAYNAAHMVDQPFPWAVRLIEALSNRNDVAIVFSTGRSRAYMESTCRQINEQWPGLQFGIYMRPVGDSTPTPWMKLRNAFDAVRFYNEVDGAKVSAVWCLDDRVDVLAAYQHLPGILTSDSTVDVTRVHVNLMNLHGLHCLAPENMGQLVSEVFAERTWIDSSRMFQPGFELNAEEKERMVSYAARAWTREELEPVVSKPAIPPNEALQPLAIGRVPSCAAADLLQSMADTFRERNAQYKDNAVLVGQVMKVFFPDGVKLESDKDFEIWHLFELVIVKLTRFVNSGLTHKDSIHDMAVYAAMIELLVDHHDIPNND